MTAIDLFAGAGGFTTGAEAAGVKVLWAANHWSAAVETHLSNHPDVRHACQDLHQADWSTVPNHDVLLASPACQGHSLARGTDRPHHDSCRSTAWAVVSCAEARRPKAIVVENVQEFSHWSLYPSWCDAMKRLGYSLSATVMNAADHGVPQDRRRLFIIAVRGKRALWVEPPKREHIPASKIITSGAFTPWRTKCTNTVARVEAGRRQHGDRFLVCYYGTARGGRSLDRPLGTVTTRDRWALVEGDGMRMLNVEEYRRAMGFPDSYRLPESGTDAKRMLGNAVCPPVATAILRELKERL